MEYRMIKIANISLAMGFSLALLVPVISQASPTTDVQTLQQTWDKINFQTSGNEAKLNALHELEKTAEQVVAANPNQAEPLIWEGIILSTDAGIVKSLSALGKVKQAKVLFEKAIQLNPNAMDGSAQASLGVLYYQVPGWPMAFGDNKKAEQYLKQALAISPNDIDSNYFYSDFLLKNKRPQEAITYLTTASKAPSRPNRDIADNGRHQQIEQALARAQKEAANG